ncbi:MAG: 3-deoxy-7-phosphoheptulonate synthase [Myxococcota bacterium]
MTEPLEDRNLVEIRTLVSPDDVKQAHPIPEPAAALVTQTRQALRDLLHGRDRQRLAVIVGPCSLHDRDAALEFASRLARVAGETRDQLVILMRAYFEKPRTTVGWKGLINDPHLDDSCDIPAGLALARQILLDIHALGLPCASEFLDPVTPQYIGDLISWAAIGARTTESQPHRQMASGLSMPVGFKNGTDGGLQVALDALQAAAARHSFLGVTGGGATAVIKTRGNTDGHVVLRGGGGRTNYSASDVAAAAEKLPSARGVLVDCSHDNSGKDHERQPGVCREVIGQFRAGQQALLGVMLESHLEPGRQDWRARPLTYGQSMTDACLGWDDTQSLLYELADTVRGRRAA